MNTYIVQYYTIADKQYTPTWMELEAENESELSSLIAEKHNCSPDDVVDIYAEKVLEDDEEYYGCIAKRIPVEWLYYFINGEVECINDEDWEEIKALEADYSIENYLSYSVSNPEFCWGWGGRNTCLALARPREK